MTDMFRVELDFRCQHKLGQGRPTPSHVAEVGHAEQGPRSLARPSSATARGVMWKPCSRPGEEMQMRSVHSFFVAAKS